MQVQHIIIATPVAVPKLSIVLISNITSSTRSYHNT